LLPNASECYLAGLLPLSNIFGQSQDAATKPSICQRLKHYFEQIHQIEGQSKSCETAIIQTRLTTPGDHSLKSYKERIEKNFELEKAGENSLTNSQRRNDVAFEGSQQNTRKWIGQFYKPCDHEMGLCRSEGQLTGQSKKRPAKKKR